MDFKLVPDDALAPGLINLGYFLPIQLGDKVCNRLTFDVWLETKQPGDRLVEIENPARFIHNQHAIFDRIEQSFEEASFAGQPGDHGLQSLRIEPANPAHYFVEETGFG